MPAKAQKPRALLFDYTLDFARVDFRSRPELYQIGKGEQGVLLVQPYKGEILPHWRFKTPEDAVASSTAILTLFHAYAATGDFVGMDMARKFLQMGYTRARRYANHRSGRKYNGAVPPDKRGQSGAHGRDQLPREEDPVKAESARIFYVAWQKAKSDETYLKLMAEHDAAVRAWLGAASEDELAAVPRRPAPPHAKPDKRV